MNVLLQVGILLLICLVGEGISAVLPFPFPSAVLSMILVFFLLWSRVIRERQIKQTTDFLLDNLLLFFVPNAAMVMEHFDLLLARLGPFVIICVVSTILCFAATALTVHFVMALQAKRRAAS
jgi:holin-like protein